jgi:hypothetical protein
MRKTIFATFLALIMSSLHGYYDVPNGCCEPVACCETTSCCDFLQGIEVNGEFLWWKGKADGLYVEIFESDSVVTPNVFSTSEKYWDFGYSPGFRLGLSYQPCQWENTGFYATFTHFRATDTLSLNLVATDDITYNVRLPFFEVPLDAADEELIYTGGADFLYNRVDVGVAKYCFNYGCLNIVPKVAFTYVHTRSSMSDDVFLSENELGSVLFIKDSFSGYGATIGFDTNYDLWSGSGFSIFSSLGFSGLWGPFQSQFQQSDFSDDILINVGSNDQSPCVGRWLSDIQVGLQYQSCLCGCYQVAARVGWEFLYLADELNFFRAIDPTSMKVSGLTVGLAVGF